LHFDRVINAGPVLNAVPSINPWASMMHNTGSHGQQYAQPWIHGDLVGIPSSDQRRPGQQLRTSANRSTPSRVAAAIPCGPGLDAVFSMDPRASMMHNLGLTRRLDAQHWIPGLAAANVGKSINSGTVGVPSSDQRRPGQQLRSPAGRVSMHNLGSHRERLALRSSDQLRAGPTPKRLESPKKSDKSE
jgi:hypothetical protein